MKLRDARVLVTGGGGFIGSHLTERLVEAGARVRAFVRYASHGGAGWLDGSAVRDSVEVIAGDITDPDCVSRAVAGCEVVFHLAALIGIPYSYLAPQSYVRTNVDGTLNVLMAARTAGVSRVVHTSTSEVYGTPVVVPITEDHSLRPQSPYAATKVAADALAMSFYASFGLPVTILRPFNTYGPRQSLRAVLPVILCQLLAGAPVVRLGALSPRRDLTFVSDTADGFMRAAFSDMAIGTTIQLGTGRDVSIQELAEIAMHVVGRRADIVSDAARVRPANSEVACLRSDPRRAADLLGWRPTTSLEDGIRRTAEWLAARGPDVGAVRYVV